MSQPSSDRQRQFFLLFLLALLPAGNALNPCLDMDTWWHLRVGQYIVSEGKLPDHDPFSQLGQSEKTPWIAYSWLYELGLYEAFRVAGFAGIMFCRDLFDLLTFGSIAWFMLNHARNVWWALGTLALVTISLLPFMPERPWHFTIFFTTLTLHAVIRIRDGAPPRRFVLLPIAYIVWANIHIQFVMGFALLGLAWLATMADWLVRGDEAKKKPAIALFLLGAACTFATLITPFHLRLYLVIWEYATQTQALALVLELQRPDLAKWWNLPLIALLLLAAAATARGGIKLWDLLLLASALFFSLRMQRDLWFGVLVSGTIVVRQFGTPGSGQKFKAWQVLPCCVLALSLMRVFWEIGLSRGKNFATCHAETYPVRAVEFVREQHLPGPLFNDFDWGGYLIWNLQELPVSIDGRTNLYGEARLNRSIHTWQGMKGTEGFVDWDTDPDLLKANVVIAPKKRGDKEFPLTARLLKDVRWRAVYGDDVAVVFVRVR